MATATQNVKLENGHLFYQEDKEEAYFRVTLTLPRVGEFSATYSADRYVARFFNGDSDLKGHDGWTNWRIMYRHDMPKGVGPKGRNAMDALVEPAIQAWLLSGSYKEAREKALADFVIRELSNHHGTLARRRAAFAKHRGELTYYDHTRIAQAIDHLEAAEALLADRERAE